MTVYANNQSNAKENYQKRSLYKQLYTSIIPQFVDFRTDRLFYGKVDYDFDTVMVRPSMMKRFGQEKPAQALNFVVDAFEDLKKYLARRNRLQPIEEGFLADFTVQRGWVDPSPLYAEYMKNINLLFLNSYLPATQVAPQIKGFSDYLKYYMDFVHTTPALNMFTRTKYFLTTMTSPNISGFCVETSLLNHADDDPKVVEYFQDKEFSFYLNAVRKYGFMIDQNAPWRLVANFSSPLMKKYMDKYGITKENIFETCFQKTYPYDIETLKRFIIFYYNNFAENVPSTKWSHSTLCGEKVRTYTRTTRREGISYSDQVDYSNKSGLGEDYWLIQYYLLRAKESDIKVDNYKKKREEKKLLLMKNYLDMEQAVEYINKEMKTTFRISSTRPPDYAPITDVTRPPAPPPSPDAQGALRVRRGQNGAGPPVMAINEDTAAGRALLQKSKSARGSTKGS